MKSKSKRIQAAEWYLTHSVPDRTQVQAAELFGIRQATVSQGVKWVKAQLAKVQ